MSEKIAKHGFGSNDPHDFLAVSLLTQVRRQRAPTLSSSEASKPENVRDSSLMQRTGRMLTEIPDLSAGAQSQVLETDSHTKESQVGSSDS
jgi:hypothetical protein